VHAEAAPALGDTHEGVDELGQLGFERGELVDDDEQLGKRLGGVAAAQVAGEISGPRLTRHALAMLQLGLQAAQRSLGEMLVEIGHHPDGVRKSGALVERAAALEVDQHEREVVGIDVGGEADEDRAQQLRLARAGRAADEPVRSVKAQVEGEHPVVCCADRRARRRIDAGRLPARQHGSRFGRIELEQRQQPDAVEKAGAGDRQLGILEAGQRPGAGACGLVGHPGDEQLIDVVTALGHVQRRLATWTAHFDDRRAHGREPVDRAGHDDASDRPAAVRSTERTGARRPSVSDSSSTTTSSVGASRSVSEPPRCWRCWVAASHVSAIWLERSLLSDRWRSPAPGSRTWGSHFAQSQSARPSAPASTATGRSAGPWCTAAWHTSDRASASAAGRSPTMPTTPPSARSTAVDRRSMLASRTTASTSAGIVLSGPSIGGLHGTSRIPARSAKRSS
jgi:hypothetical protein